MQLLKLVVTILLLGHIFAFIYGSIFRYVRLAFFIRYFGKTGVITPEEHARLDQELVFFIFASAPDFHEYRKLYDDPEFLNFVFRWRRRRNYYIMASAFLFLAFLMPG